MHIQYFILGFATCISLASAGVKQLLTHLHGIPKSRADADRPSAMSNASFEQLLNHDDPSSGNTFSQSYYYSDEFWGGPGFPIIFMNNGESAVEAEYIKSYFTNTSITGAFAQAVHGAVVVLEHRFWGHSSPYDNLTTENLQQLSLRNAIADMTYFARNVRLPFDKNSSSNAPQAPWVLSGGSYAGALAAWTASTAPGTFWAYHASSAPVQAINDFWSFSLPIQEGMPQNCSKDVTRVVGYIDAVFDSGSIDNQTAVKKLFGLEGLEHVDDFAAAIVYPLFNWQVISSSSQFSEFWSFCDAVESGGSGNFTNSSIPGADGVGLSTALKGYSTYFSSIVGNVSYFDTYDNQSSTYTDTSVDSDTNRQWEWMLCNSPFHWWQKSGFPEGRPSLISRHVNASHSQRQCELYFSTMNGYTFDAVGNTTDDLNAWTGGWDLTTNAKRLMWVNGEFDGWRSAGVSSGIRPGGPLNSTDEAPVYIIPGGHHCWDLLFDQGPQALLDVVDKEVQQMHDWVAEFYGGSIPQPTR